MRWRAIAHVLGALSLSVAVGIAVAAIVAAAHGGPDTGPLLLAALVPVVVGVLLLLVTRRARGEELGLKDGFAVVVGGWMLACVFGAIPFATYARFGATERCDGTPIAGSEFCSVSNCLYESMSGFTTTGASVIERGLWTDPAGPDAADGPEVYERLLPHGLLFWRGLTHWFGGMGIIVLSLAILPYLGIGGLSLYRAEVPGPTRDKLVPRLADTAKILWLVYVGMTVLQTLLLLLAGVDITNALVHTFATMGTGGFSNLAASVGGFGSVWVELIVIAFMFLAGANFSLHFAALKGRSLARYLANDEFRLYALVILAASGLVALALVVIGGEESVLRAVRLAVFQVVSVMTTTGFATDDFARWVPAGQLSLLLLMFVGGCAGSTGGGPKVVRLLAVMRIAGRELVRAVHPRAVVRVRVNAQPVAEHVLSAIVAFMLLYVGLFAASSLVLTFLGMDVVSATSAVAANLGNVGPGLATVGPAAHFNGVPLPGKWLLTFLMLVGRLELFTVLVLFARPFWRR